MSSAGCVDANFRLLYGLLLRCSRSRRRWRWRRRILAQAASPVYPHPGGDRLHNIASHRSFVRPFVCRVPPRTCRRTNVLCSLPITYYMYMYLCVRFRKYRTAISQAKCMFFFFVVSPHACLVGSRSFSLPRTLFWLCFPLAIRKLTPAPGVLVIAP